LPAYVGIHEEERVVFGIRCFACLAYDNMAMS